MKKILFFIFLFTTNLLHAASHYQYFEGKWQEEKRIVKKGKHKITQENATNQMQLDFVEEGIYTRIYPDARMLAGHILIKGKKLVFYLEDNSNNKSYEDKTFSSFEINATSFVLHSKDTTIYLKKVNQFTYKPIEKLTNNNTKGEVNIDIKTLQGSWKRYKTMPAIVIDKDEWGLFHLRVEYSVAANRYVGSAQFTSMNEGQHVCDITLVPKKEKNEIIISEEDTEGVKSRDLKIKIKILTCDGKELIIKQGEMTYFYYKD